MHLRPRPILHSIPRTLPHSARDWEKSPDCVRAGGDQAKAWSDASRCVGLGVELGPQLDSGSGSEYAHQGFYIPPAPVCQSNKAVDAVLAKVLGAYGSDAPNWSARTGHKESISAAVLDAFAGDASSDVSDKEVVFTNLFQAGRSRGPKSEDGGPAPLLDQQTYETLIVDEASQILGTHRLPHRPSSSPPSQPHVTPRHPSPPPSLKT